MTGASSSARTFQAFPSTEASTVNPLHTNLRTALAGVCQASETHQPSQLPHLVVAITPLAGNVITALPPGGSVLRTAFERTPRAVRIFFGGAA